MNLKSFGIVIPIFLLLTCGCATKYTPLTSEQSNKIQKVGLLVVPASEQMSIIDHTKVMSQGSVVGYQFGLLGGLIEGVSLAIIANKKVEDSLGGEPDLLQAKLENFEITNYLRQKIKNRLSQKYQVILLEKTDNEEELIKAGKENGVDTILEMGFVYGLAGYANEKASPVVVADIKIRNVSSATTLIERRLSSDSYFRTNNVVEEFAKDDAELFKNSIHIAANTVSTLVASEFGIDTDKIPEEHFAESMRYSAASCNKPYDITQDCNFFTGAEREIELNGYKAKVAGSENGKVILIVGDGHLLNSMSDAFTLGYNDSRTEPSKKALNFIKRKLQKEGIQIIKITKLMSRGGIDGYFLELDGDGYSILKKYSL